jgi:hypothetical protein
MTTRREIPRQRSLDHDSAMVFVLTSVSAYEVARTYMYLASGILEDSVLCFFAM